MKAIRSTFILICLGVFFTTNTFSQSLSSPDTIKKHQLGITSDYNAGRVLPGIQYYFGLKRNQQFGVNLSFMHYKLNTSSSVLGPRISIEYRFKKNLVSGLNGYAAPLLQYSHQFTNNNGNTYNSGQFGLGMSTGLEYDFSNKDIPFILGAGIRAVGHYKAGRFGYGVTPSFSLRVKL